MKKAFSLILALAVLAALLAGCGSDSASANGRYDYAAEAPMEAYAEEALTSSASMSGDSSTISQLPQNRKWVITMSISSETEDLDSTLASIQEKISSLGGYIEDQYITNNSSYRRSRSADMTVRIPADKVDNFSTAVSQVSNVTSTSRNVKDITLTYTDTESRIAALRAEETRLLELMAQAADMSDLLTIEERLTEVRYQLEGYSSQLRKYDNQVDYATIDLSIDEVQQYTPVEKQTLWQRIQLGFVGSLGSLIEDLGDLLVGVVTASPYLAVLAIFVAVIIVIVRACTKRSKAKRMAEYQKRMQQVQAQNQPNQQNNP